MKKNKKGQLALMGLIFGVMILFTWSILSGIIIDFVEIGVNSSQNATHGALMTTVLNAMPVFILLMVLVSIIALITGRQQ